MKTIIEIEIPKSSDGPCFDCSLCYEGPIDIDGPNTIEMCKCKTYFCEYCINGNEILKFFDVDIKKITQCSFCSPFKEYFHFYDGYSNMLLFMLRKFKISKDELKTMMLSELYSINDPLPINIKYRYLFPNKIRLTIETLLILFYFGISPLPIELIEIIIDILYDIHKKHNEQIIYEIKYV